MVPEAPDWPTTLEELLARPAWHAQAPVGARGRGLRVPSLPPATHRLFDIASRRQPSPNLPEGDGARRSGLGLLTGGWSRLRPPRNGAPVQEDPLETPRGKPAASVGAAAGRAVGTNDDHGLEGPRPVPADIDGDTIPVWEHRYEALAGAGIWHEEDAISDPRTMSPRLRPRPRRLHTSVRCEARLRSATAAITTLWSRPFRKAGSESRERAAVIRHHPKLIHRNDGRWEVRCRQCQQNHQQTTPIGIGIPISNMVEAESIARNHADASLRVAS